MRVQAKLRFVHDDHVWQIVLRLLQERDEADRAQGAIRQLMGSEYQIGVPMPPVENDVRSVQPGGLQVEVHEEGGHLCDVSDDSTIDHLMF